MPHDPEDDKLEEMTNRIRQAEMHTPAAEEEADDTESFKISGIGFDFIGAVIVCGFIGWLIDKGLGTKPWGIVAMLVIGFAIGITNVWRALGSQKSE